MFQTDASTPGMCPSTMVAEQKDCTWLLALQLIDWAILCPAHAACVNAVCASGFKAADEAGVAGQGAAQGAHAAGQWGLPGSSCTPDVK